MRAWKILAVVRARARGVECAGNSHNPPLILNESTVGLRNAWGRENYEQQNVSILSERGMLKLATEAVEARSYAFGRLSLGQLPWDRFPRPVSMLAHSRSGRGR
jgi:hypothetical protein